MLKRIISGSVIFFMLCIMSYFVIQALKPEKLPIGSKMPEVVYQALNEKKILTPNDSTFTFIMYFDQNCKHCRYMLKVLNKFYDKLKNVRLILLTSDEKFMETRGPRFWANLYPAPNVIWGIIDREQYARQFGRIVTPSLFIFDQTGHLIWKRKGEIRIEKIVEVINHSGDPEHRIRSDK